MTMIKYDQRKPAEKAIEYIDKIFKKEQPVIEKTLEKIRNSPGTKYKLGTDDHVRARYHEDCSYINEKWGDTQHDGPALCLSAFSEYANRYGDQNIFDRKSTLMMIDYLSLVWDTPSNCLWEMFGDFLHSYTLGSVYSALQKCKNFTNEKAYVAHAAKSVKDSIVRDFVRNGIVKKMQKPFGEPLGIDSSVLWLFSDFNVFSMEDKEERHIIEKTTEHVYKALSHDGIGLKRYHVEEWGDNGKDKYYGGGTWMNLTLLGARVQHKIHGRGAGNVLDYFGKTFPEQLIGDSHVFDVAERNGWVQGSIKHCGLPGPATPLAWSVSSYLDLLHELYPQS
jgi:GH15 family glucan-1,4-alpha-glucosidase